MVQVPSISPYQESSRIRHFKILNTRIGICHHLIYPRMTMLFRISAQSTIALLIFNRLVSLTDPVFTTSVTYIIPVVAICWGLVDNEVLLLTHVVGIVGILVGVYITNTARKK